MGQAAQMTPPSINVEFAPPSRDSGFGPPKLDADMDSLSPPMHRKMFFPFPPCQWISRVIDVEKQVREAGANLTRPGIPLVAQCRLLR
jgi:hypothetical protein